MFVTSKTIDIFHTLTIDVRTLEEGMGESDLGGICTPPYISMPPYVQTPPTHIYVPFVF